MHMKMIFKLNICNLSQRDLILPYVKKNCNLIIKIFLSKRIKPVLWQKGQGSWVLNMMISNACRQQIWLVQITFDVFMLYIILVGQCTHTTTGIITSSAGSIELVTWPSLLNYPLVRWRLFLLRQVDGVFKDDNISWKVHYRTTTFSVGCITATKNKNECRTKKWKNQWYNIC